MQPPEPVAPQTYADWCVWLDQLEIGTHDEDLLLSAERSRTDWTAAVAKLFATRLHTSLNNRLNRIGRSMEQRLGACREEASVTLALVRARQEFQGLGRFGNVTSFPEALREGVRNLVRHHVDARQAALEKSALADRSGRLSLAIRRTPLNLQLAVASTVQDVAARGEAPGRRIIVDQPGVT